VKFWFACLGWLVATAAAAQVGGLYISGTNFTFGEAVERGIAMNPNSTRFFVLAVGDAVRGLSVVAPPELVEIRNRGAAAGALYLVCQRDLDRGDFSLTDLVPGVVPVRGFPPRGSSELPHGERYFPDEDPSNLPESNELLRRLRATCS
jgi:hypothetical protein